MNPIVVTISGWPPEPISSPRIARAVEVCGAGAAGWVPLRTGPLLFFVVANETAAMQALAWLRTADTNHDGSPANLVASVHGGGRYFAHQTSGLMALPTASYKVFAQGPDSSLYRLFPEKGGGPERPTRSLSFIQIFSEGQLFPASVLDVSEDELIGRFMSGVKTIAAISLAISYPTLASVTHSLVNSYKNVLAVALETDYTFPEVEALKDRLANPEAYAAAAPAATEPGSAPAAKEEKAAEEEEESDDDLGFGLFD